jgi:predicted cobalt transporter CbtA
MSSTGTLLIGIGGGIMFLLAVLALRERNWKGGCLWFIAGLALIALLTFMDKP